MYIGHACVFDAEDRPPNRGIIDADEAISHGRFEHGVNNQIKAHARAETGHSTLAKCDDRKTRVGKLQHGTLALKLRNAVRISRAYGTVLIKQFILGIPVYGTRAGVDVASNACLFGDVAEVSGGSSVEHEILSRRKFRHRVIGQPGQENYLLVLLKIAGLQVKNILIYEPHFGSKQVSKPQQIHDIDVVASFQQFRY